MFCGTIVASIRDFPPFNTYAALGGVLFATANLLTVPVINIIGSALALLLGGSVSITVGWASAR